MKIIKQYKTNRTQYADGGPNLIYGLGDDGDFYYAWEKEDPKHWMLALTFKVKEMKEIVDNFYHLLPFLEK